MLKKIINSAAECELLGFNISKKLKSGHVISLEGDLGSGKTTFVKGILKGLNYKYDVTSPTFTLINEYHADLKVIHIDFYREGNIERWREIGIDEITPIITEFSEKKTINLERCKKIMISAIKQSNNYFLPKINKIQNFNNFIINNKNQNIYISHCKQKNANNPSKDDLLCYFSDENYLDTFEQIGFVIVNAMRRNEKVMNH